MKIGFASKIWRLPVDKQQEDIAAYGVDGIYTVGEGAETLDEAVRKLKRDPLHRVLCIAADFRVFGDTQAKIFAATTFLESAGIRVVDVRQPKLTLSELTRIGLSALAGYNRWKGGKRDAKRNARRGGEAKRTKQAEKRTGIADEKVIRAIASAPELSWKRKENILGISQATLRRHYL